MNKQKQMTCYLAGPVGNLSSKQQSQWRTDLKKKLSPLGWRCINPVLELTPAWSPLKEFELIDRADVLVAYFWKESVGTVVGILQARRLGKPVVLVLPTYIESRVLIEIVGDKPLYSLEEVPTRLQQLREYLTEPLAVSKHTDRGTEPFDPKKLIRAVTNICSEAELNDDWLPSNITRSVIMALRRKKQAVVSSDEVRKLVSDSLSALPRRADGAYGERIKDKTARAVTLWANRAKPKALINEIRTLEDKLAREKASCRDLEEKIKSCEDDNRGLNHRLKERDEVALNATSAIDAEHQEGLDQLEKKLRGTTVACCGNNNSVQEFRRAVKAGLNIDDAEYDRHFEHFSFEHTSKQRQELAHAVQNRIAIYASDGLHVLFGPEKKKVQKKAIELFVAQDVKNAVSLFHKWLLA